MADFTPSGFVDFYIEVGRGMWKALFALFQSADGLALMLISLFAWMAGSDLAGRLEERWGAFKQARFKTSVRVAILVVAFIALFLHANLRAYQSVQTEARRLEERLGSALNQLEIDQGALAALQKRYDDAVRVAGPEIAAEVIKYDDGQYLKVASRKGETKISIRFTYKNVGQSTARNVTIMGPEGAMAWCGDGDAAEPFANYKAPDPVPLDLGRGEEDKWEVTLTMKSKDGKSFQTPKQISVPLRILYGSDLTPGAVYQTSFIYEVSKNKAIPMRNEVGRRLQ